VSFLFWMNSNQEMNSVSNDKDEVMIKTVCAIHARSLANVFVCQNCPSFGDIFLSLRP
jgi:hypothetical protein